MRRLRSARFRRRLLLAGAVTAAVVAVGALVVLLPEAHRQPEVFRDVPADVPEATPPVVTPSAALRAALVGETVDFVQTAVRRKDLRRSFPLVHPALRQGLTRKQWLTGAIPIVPFPATRIVEWRIVRAYADDVAADVVLEPERGSGLYRKTFTIEFKRVGTGPGARWLVYAWVPNGVSDALVQAEHEPQVEAALARVKGHQGLPVEWVLIPVGLILAAFALPLVLIGVERRRLRRAEEAHSRALAERYGSRPS